MQTIFGKMKASKKIINKILQPEKTGINKIMIKENRFILSCSP